MKEFIESEVEKAMVRFGLDKIEDEQLKARVRKAMIDCYLDGASSAGMDSDVFNYALSACED